MSCYPHDRTTVKVTAKIVSTAEISVLLPSSDHPGVHSDDDDRLDRIDRARAQLVDYIATSDRMQRAQIATLVNAFAVAAVGCSGHIDEAPAAEKLLAAVFLESVAAAIRAPSARELFAAVMTTPLR